LWVALAIVAAVILVPIGVANRHVVSVTLDPFGRMNTSLAFDIPLSLLLFIVLFVGILLGGLATWLGQGKWRRTARRKSREVYHWKSEADRLSREVGGGAGDGRATTGGGRSMKLVPGR
jgi:hypothetical protein